jgi:hypothetical protein
MEHPKDHALPCLEERAGQVLLKVRAAPGARGAGGSGARGAKGRIVGLLGDALKVAVSAPPEKGKANEAIALVLSAELGLRSSQVSLARGDTSRDKTFHLRGVSLESACERLWKRLEPREATGRP